MSIVWSRGLLLFVLSVSSVVAGVAHADPVGCQRAIAKEAGKFTAARSKALQGCEDLKASRKLAAGTECTLEAKTAASLQKASDKLRAGIAKQYGGGNRVCSQHDVGPNADDALATIVWDIGTCPGLDGGSCAHPLVHCGDVAACVECVGARAIDQSLGLYYDALDPSVFGGKSALAKCQRAIGKEATKVLQARGKLLQGCWDKRIRGVHAQPCPAPGDGAAVPGIAKAESVLVRNVCKECGGSDRTCGGGDDLSPDGIGFVATCPALTAPGGTSCGGPVDSLPALVECVRCVTEFDAGCADLVTVPQLADYPASCFFS